jgi:acyl-CoA thioesterase-1
LLAAICALAALQTPALAEPARIVAFGDSLTAGLGLDATDTFPVKLEAALKAKGYDVRIVNAGVSGDTASTALARLDWSIADRADAVILELGANDALRGISPAVTRQAIDSMLRRLKERKIEVLLAGMRAPRNLGSEYVAAFDAIYPELARTHDVVFYPFFLEGVVTDPRLNQQDGMHPTAAGVDVVVQRILPSVEALLRRVRAHKGT